MALLKEKTVNGITVEYHTPIIMQDGKKNTKIAISSFINEAHYVNGNSPILSRVDVIDLDSKYPTAEEIYTAITESKLDEDGVETNWYVDAEAC